MFRKFGICTIVMLALIGVGATRAWAQGQPGPFSIEHNTNGTVGGAIVIDGSNSGVAGGYSVPPCDSPSTQACKQVDPTGNSQELGPKNGSPQQIGVIHKAPLPMLDDTNPNGQVDFNIGWTQSKSVSDQIWFYFAWNRDKNTGSGFISVELDKLAPPAACKYDANPGETAQQVHDRLLASCNPFANRTAGDFIILWDQQGGSRELKIRVFSSPIPACSTTPGCVLTLGEPITTQFPYDAEYCSSGFCGEASVNLTAAVGLGAAGSCSTLANTIPGTVTGNSDTADYKDVILAPFPAISNCGTVTVTKVTQPTNDLSGTFPFTLNAASNIFFTGGVDADCNDSGSNEVNCKHTFTQGGQSVTITNLIAGAPQSYSLAENTAAMAPSFGLVSISCTVPGGSGTVSSTSSPLTGITVAAGGTTNCTITNALQQGSIKVIKHVINDDGGTLLAPAFTMSLNDTNPATTPFAGSETGTTTSFYAGHAYHVTETLPAGYSLVDMVGDCQGTIESNVEKVCTVTNTDQPANLIIIKTVINNSGGTAVTGDFGGSIGGTATFAGGTAWTGVASPGQNHAMTAAGSYSVTETAFPGYDTTYDSGCSGNIALGQTKTCTVTNNDQPAKLIIIKTVINDNGGTKVAGDFSGAIGGTATFAGGATWTGVVTPGQTHDMTAAGTYNVTETAVAGYDTGYDAGCTGTIALGQTKTCTVTNNDVKATPGGTTDQRAILHDSVTITGIRTGAGDASSARVTFRLYSDDACQTQVGQAEGPLAIVMNGNVGTGTTTVGVAIDPAGNTTFNYRWRVTYTGDQFNSGFTTACGSEVTTITMTPQ